MGEILVEDSHLWGAQTQRSLQNFAIGTERIPREVIEALVILKLAASRVNHSFGKLDEERATLIGRACEEILSGSYEEEFPLKVWQTGSGTQSNMNVNEVISHLAVRDLADPSAVKIHPNDHVNLSQSSNDTFPTALHVAAVRALTGSLLPALREMTEVLRELEAKEENIAAIKIGRTHLQDAVPIRFSQEISGWRGMLEESTKMVEAALPSLRKLAIGGTAVGTGLNAPEGFDAACAAEISHLTGEQFVPAENKFYALTSKDACVFAHGALKALAADLMKIANDIRWLASGPRCGLGEIRIPENEPGSSIMPGKVNPTQCEALTMIAVQVMGNDAAIGFAASQGNFELNVFMPVIAYNLFQSIRLLSDGMHSFVKNCLRGLKANPAAMRSYLDRSLMLVTALTPVIGYEKAAAAAHKAHEEGLSLKEAVTAMGLMSEEEYDTYICPEKLV